MVNLYARNFMHAKTSLRSSCVHACHRALSLLRPVPDLFQFSNLLQLLNNQLRQDFCITFFFKCGQEIFKNGKCQLLKMARFCYTVILIMEL